jgi:hypothetical protein
MRPMTRMTKSRRKRKKNTRTRIRLYVFGLWPVSTARTDCRTGTGFAVQETLHGLRRDNLTQFVAGYVQYCEDTNTTERLGFPKKSWPSKILRRMKRTVPDVQFKYLWRMTKEKLIPSKYHDRKKKDRPSTRAPTRAPTLLDSGTHTLICFSIS